MEDLTGKQFGIYELGEPLGEGGMAAVYKAYQPTMNRFVAIKVLPRQMARNNEFTTRFKREAQLLAQLQHPHILPIFDYGQADGYTYIVMPLMQSGTLADLLKTRRLTMPEIQRIISQIGDALGYAHARGMIHRDVKPSNVLLDERGNCLLTDFGLARMTEATSRLTSSGAIMGTPAYMSPEQGSGPNVDGRSDLYSLGVMLYEMVTGQIPYTADTPFALVLKHITDPLPSPRKLMPDLSYALELVMIKALAKKPADRYQNAEEFIKALDEAIVEKPKSQPPAVPTSSQETAISMPPAPIRMRTPVAPPATSEPPQRRPAPISSPAPTLSSAPPPAPKRRLLPWALAVAGAIGACLVVIALLAVGYAYFFIPTLTINLLDTTPEVTATITATPRVAAKTATVIGPTSTSAPQATSSPLPDPPTVAIPADTKFSRINSITTNAQGKYVVEYETFEYNEKLPGQHVHFFFNTVPVSEAGVPGAGNWVVYGGPRPFTGYGTGDRPANASQMCILVANANHTIISNTGNCVPLPNVAAVIARVDTPCLDTPTEIGNTVVTFKAGAGALLKGFSADKSWLLIQNPVKVDTTTCWVPIESSVTSGDTSKVPTVNP